MTPKEPLVWIDLETTGLNVEEDTILEIACIVTDGTLEEIYEGPDLVIRKDKPTLRKMSEWCLNQHGNTGLIEACLSSTTNIQQAEETIIQFVKTHIPSNNIGLLAGSSVHFDKEFLRKEMPTLFNYLHYRIVDVSSVGELVKRWFPTVMRRRPRKSGNHRALADIKDSINELKFYKESAFRLR
jgi:oligoribonuclease